jgi:hypothetical protein
MMLISPPELADGRAAWEAFLARLAAAPAPDDPSWVWARATAVDTIAWFESQPADAPARRLG